MDYNSAWKNSFKKLLGGTPYFNPNYNLTGQISGRWNFGKVIKPCSKVQMSPFFPDFEKIGKKTNNAKEAQWRPKTHSRGVNLRACNLGCANHHCQPCPWEWGLRAREIFFFYASGGGCTSSPRTAKKPRSPVKKCAFQ